MRNLSARAGRWSAAHWKTAVLGWIVLVAVLFALSSRVDSKQVTSADVTSGDSKVAEQILLSAGFPPRVHRRERAHPAPLHAGHRPGLPGRGR
jgi:hypothetical protein